jgi:2-polyprenyl-3-methyl-5-hydroxy-6-metoxy-1,4-benzoquinol methylase
VGIEYSSEMAKEASKRIDQVFVGDALEIFKSDRLHSYYFDTIIFADILEHLVDPWDTLKTSTQFLHPQGAIVASIPNIRFFNTLYNLVIKGYWPYRQRGIHDRTHLRFFTLRNIRELFRDAGLTIELIKRNYRIIEKPHKLNLIAWIFALPGIKGFLTHQYLIRARKAEYYNQ